MGRRYPEIRFEDRFAFRINEVAVALGLSASSIYDLASDDKLKLTKIAGRTLVLRSDVEALLAEARSRPETPPEKRLPRIRTASLVEGR